MIQQLFRFGIIGSCAALVNMVVVFLLVEHWQWQPLVANIVAFLIAYQVSFFGHQYWTFRRATTQHVAMPWVKFFIVASASFVLNEGLYALFLHVFHWQYLLALFLVLVIVPPVTFVFSKFWAFRT